MAIEATASINSTKNKYISSILALFLGSFGAHKFYIGHVKSGLYYLVFFWTGIPMIIGWGQAIHYLIMDSEEYHLRVNKKYDKNKAKDDKNTKISNTADDENEDDEFTIDVPSDAIIAAEGLNGEVIVFKNRIRISRENISLLQKTQQWGKGEKEISMKNVTSVQLRKPSSFTVGYIQFGQEGYVQAGGSQFDAVDDENSVTFTKDDLEKFEKVRDKVRELTSEDVEIKQAEKDPVETLKQRYAEGEISEEEFNKKKEFLTKN